MEEYTNNGGQVQGQCGSGGDQQTIQPQPQPQTPEPQPAPAAPADRGVEVTPFERKAE